MTRGTTGPKESQSYQRLTVLVLSINRRFWYRKSEDGHMWTKEMLKTPPGPGNPGPNKSGNIFDSSY